MLAGHLRKFSHTQCFHHLGAGRGATVTAAIFCEAGFLSCITQSSGEDKKRLRGETIVAQSSRETDEEREEGTNVNSGRPELPPAQTKR